MPISRYPRRGQSIAPAFIREHLGTVVEISGRDSARPTQFLLRDADETCWDRFSYETCLSLGEHVVNEVRHLITHLPPELAAQRLPMLPGGMTLDDLDLETRTYRSLARAGYAHSPEALGLLTIRDVLRLRGFGAKCLVDLLVTLECIGSVGAASAESPQLTPDWMARVTALEAFSRVSCRDPRLGLLMRGLLSNWTDILGNFVAQIPRMDPRYLRAVSGAVDKLLCRLQEASSYTLERELFDIIGSVTAGLRNRGLIALLWGWDGLGGTTLEAAGQAYGLTRERVRQIAAKAEGRLSQLPVFAPSLGKARDVLISRSPGLADDLECELVGLGISEKPFRLEGIVHALWLLYHEESLVLSVSGGKRTLSFRGDGEIGSTVLRVARRMVAHWGVANLQDVGEEAGCNNERLLTAVLEGESSFSWLDRERGWFWFNDSRRNPLRTRIRKVLAVADTITIGELRLAVSRPYRARGFSPTRRVLREACSQMRGCTVQGDLVTAVEPSMFLPALTSTERILVRALRESGGLLDRPRLEEICREAGMNRSTFYVYIGYSPVVISYARGVYGLPGTPVPPGTIAALQPRRRTNRVLADFGWTADGNVWLEYRLSPAMLANGSFAVPSSMSERLEGDYSLLTPSAACSGEIRCRGSRAWGIGKFLQRRGAEAGDVVTLVFDLRARTVTVFFGEWSEMQAEMAGKATLCTAREYPTA